MEAIPVLRQEGDHLSHHPVSFQLLQKASNGMATGCLTGPWKEHRAHPAVLNFLYSYGASTQFAKKSFVSGSNYDVYKREHFQHAFLHIRAELKRELGLRVEN
jgi:hypothetical protein